MARLVVHGARELDARLRRLEDDLDDMTATHDEAADVLLAEARRKVRRRTGRLGRSLRGQGSRTAAVLTSALPYAGVQQFGWPGHHIAAHPFFPDPRRDPDRAVLAIYDKALDRLTD